MITTVTAATVFKELLEMAVLQLRFDLRASILLTKGSRLDTRDFVAIT
ncbi:MAG: hypothetical protein ACRYFV_24595 [Janthinobacterium lividum]